METAEETHIGQTGHVYIAPVGTDFPADINEDVDLGVWTEVGYVTTDGVKFTSTPNFQAFRAWQKRRPIRQTKGDVDDVVALSLLQWNSDTVTFAYGGGTVTEDGSGAFTYHPPAEDEFEERALIIESSDGANKLRFGFARGIQTGAVEFTWSRAAMSMLPISFSVLASDEADDWFFQTNLADFAATGS